jgi:hypothetical protein
MNSPQDHDTLIKVAVDVAYIREKLDLAAERVAWLDKHAVTKPMLYKLVGGVVTVLTLLSAMFEAFRGKAG